MNESASIITAVANQVGAEVPGTVPHAMFRIVATTMLAAMALAEMDDSPLVASVFIILNREIARAFNVTNDDLTRITMLTMKALEKEMFKVNHATAAKSAADVLSKMREA